MAGMSSLTGGGGLSADMGSSASNGDIFNTTNATQGGLNINKGLSVPPWATGVAAIGGVIVTGVYLWKKAKK
jgi:hypothetical protein